MKVEFAFVMIIVCETRQNILLNKSTNIIIINKKN